MTAQNALATIVACYLSRFDDAAYSRLDMGSKAETHAEIGRLLGVKPSYVKLRRDEFDATYDTPRVGWNQRPPAPACVRTKELLDDLDEEAIHDLVSAILYEPTARASAPVSQYVSAIAEADMSQTSLLIPEVAIPPPTMRILFGPPGTGKTYQAAREAVKLLDGDVDDSTVVERHRELMDQGRIIWVTFHPSYSYEDFVEGFRPVKGSEAGVGYAVQPGPFRVACDASSAPQPSALFSTGEKIKVTTAEYEVVAVDRCGMVLTSDVDRKDGVNASSMQYVDFWTLSLLSGKGIDPADLSIPGTANARKQKFALETGLSSQLLGHSGPLRAAYETFLERSGNREATPVVLVIDEINRADLSRVFGELITLLEPDKRLGANEEKRVVLPYSNDLFGVPAALSIIGTMNTADRSLAVVDYALRRRFEFEEVEPNTELCPDDYGGLDMGALLESWNRAISALLSRDNRIGHADLMERKLEGVRERQGFDDKDDGRARAVAWTIRRKVLPLLLEYFHDDWVRAAVVLGYDRSLGDDKGQLFGEVEFDDVTARLGDDFVEEQTSFRLHPWWDPVSGEWDADRFRRALVGTADSAAQPGGGQEDEAPVAPGSASG